ncbi:NrdR family transcriptional regulator [Diaphorobacter caeni]
MRERFIPPKCPECGAWTEVLETRKRKTSGEIHRRVLCANGHRFTDVEKVRGFELAKKKAAWIASLGKGAYEA